MEENSLDTLCHYGSHTFIRGGTTLSTIPDSHRCTCGLYSYGVWQTICAAQPARAADETTAAPKSDDQARA